MAETFALATRLNTLTQQFDMPIGAEASQAITSAIGKIRAARRLACITSASDERLDELHKLLLEAEAVLCGGE